MSPNKTSFTSIASAAIILILAVAYDKPDWAIVYSIATLLMFTIVFLSPTSK